MINQNSFSKYGNLITCTQFLIVRPKITLEPGDSVNAKLGGEINLACQAVGTPIPTIKWSWLPEGFPFCSCYFHYADNTLFYSANIFE